MLFEYPYLLITGKHNVVRTLLLDKSVDCIFLNFFFKCHKNCLSFRAWSERNINIANGNPQIVFNLIANIHWKEEWSVIIKPVADDRDFLMDNGI